MTPYALFQLVQEGRGGQDAREAAMGYRGMGDPPHRNIIVRLKANAHTELVTDLMSGRNASRNISIRFGGVAIVEAPRFAATEPVLIQVAAYVALDDNLYIRGWLRFMPCTSDAVPPFRCHLHFDSTLPAYTFLGCR
jgi:hypothetical protein